MWLPLFHLYLGIKAEKKVPISVVKKKREWDTVIVLFHCYNPFLMAKRPKCKLWTYGRTEIFTFIETATLLKNK